MLRTQIAIATLLLVSACTADESGTIEVALTGQAPSGTAYRLRDAELVITGAGTTRVFHTETDPDRLVIEARLPPGAYTLGIADGWFLERRQPDGTHERAPAMLTTANPAPFAIQADVETRLTLRFLAGADDVALGDGDLIIDIGIDEVDAASPDAAVTSPDAAVTPPDAGDPDAGAPGGPGGFCDEATACGGGLFCVDSVCCNSACNGGCEACDLPGTAGTCTAVAAGQDPDSECGEVSCVGFFAGFIGDFCTRKADVASDVAACDGAGACRTQAEECSLQTMPGPVVSACHDYCQNPVPGTCAGTVPGMCSNTNPGTQLCGVGQCARTAPQCQDGAPATCTPGAPQAETCNDLDDNCDGTTDNGNFADLYEPNQSCDLARTLGGVGSDGTVVYEGMTVYGSGDHDVYRVTMTESDTSCGCAFPGDIFDEDYLASVEIEVPAGGGSYVVCLKGDGTCNFGPADCIEVGAGQSGRLEQWLDGTCTPFSPIDSYDVRILVRGDNAPAFECRPYTLRYGLDAGYCRQGISVSGR